MLSYDTCHYAGECVRFSRMSRNQRGPLDKATAKDCGCLSAIGLLSGRTLHACWPGLITFLAFTLSWPLQAEIIGYRYKIMARSGEVVRDGAKLRTISHGVSINDQGLVAFHGTTDPDGYDGIFLANGKEAAWRMSLGGLGSADRSYGPPQINNEGNVVAWERFVIPASPARPSVEYQFLMRYWKQPGGLFQTVAKGTINSKEFTGALGYRYQWLTTNAATINNLNQVAFLGQLRVGVAQPTRRASLQTLKQIQSSSATSWIADRK